MPSTKPSRPDKEIRLKSILSFAADVESQLETVLSSGSHDVLCYDLQKYVLEFPSNLGPSAASKFEDIDGIGTSLWNLCTQLRRNYDSDHAKNTPSILIVARVFAFQLLDGALECTKSITANTLRLMKIGTKAAKNCLDIKRLDLALKVLERLGAYEAKFSTPDADSAVRGREVHQRFIAEYYVLRTALAWHQDQMDMAEHMFNKSISSHQMFDSNTAESLADVLYEMGKDLLQKKQYMPAAKWLKRALEVLTGQELDRLSMDASELKISIAESFIKALLGKQDQESVDEARSLVEALENEVGDKLVVLLLKLDLLSSATNETFESNSYADVLRRMTRSTVLNAEIFKLIMYHIRKLNDKSSTLACQALDELLKLRVLPEDNQEWVEKILITRLYMIVGQKDNTDALTVLNELFSFIVSNIKQPVSSTATLAAHGLLWKRIESNYTQGQIEMTEKWCRLAIHPIFENSGELNVARISRKLLLCALAEQDFGSATDIFGSMSEVAKNEPMTRFLMYKIAIRCEHPEFAAKCLQIISSSSSKDPTLLYACVLDAQQIGDKPQTLAALQFVLEKFGTGPPSNIHLPSLLRLTIMLTVTLIDNSDAVERSTEADETIEKLCSLFEGGCASMRKPPRASPSSDTIWTMTELDWFSKNSYNLSINHLSHWSPRHSLRMLQCCIVFIDQYPADISEQLLDDLSLRKIFCEFCAVAALIVLARGGDHVETSLQDYLNLRKHVASFDNLLQSKLDKVEEGPAQDLLQKLSVLLAFDFEAACQLKAWDDLGEIILKADICKEMRVYELMADCILCSQPPTDVLITTLKKIVNGAWDLDSLDSTKLAKYMRCLFQISLSERPDIATELLGQICSHAEEAAETEHPYPAEELEWVAIRAFNHAVDLYISQNDEGCKEWAGRALSLAHFRADGGALERLLQSKWAGLKFDGNA